MSTDTQELPTVARIAADLKEIEAEEAALATLRATGVRVPRTTVMRHPSLRPTRFWNAVESLLHVV